MNRGLVSSVWCDPFFCGKVSVVWPRLLGYAGHLRFRIEFDVTKSERRSSTTGRNADGAYGGPETQRCGSLPIPGLRPGPYVDWTAMVRWIRRFGGQRQPADAVPWGCGRSRRSSCPSFHEKHDGGETKPWHEPLGVQGQAVYGPFAGSAPLERDRCLPWGQTFYLPVRRPHGPVGEDIAPS